MLKSHALQLNTQCAWSLLFIQCKASFIQPQALVPVVVRATQVFCNVNLQIPAAEFDICKWKGAAYTAVSNYSFLCLFSKPAVTCDDCSWTHAKRNHGRYSLAV